VGDILLMHTDGLVDAENGSGEFFGTERLSNLLSKLQDIDPEDILAGIFKELTSFLKGNPLSDDVSLVILKVIS
jgi:sigma-B regulation protein RsbU (phosphoserine phosphatase)